MKTFNIKAIPLFLFILVTTYISKAQCSTISNTLGCGVTVDVNIIDAVPACNNVCTSYTGVYINANPGSYNINCAGCSYCYIEVTVTDMNGTPMSVTVDSSGLNSGPAALGTVSGCSGGPAWLYWNSGTNTFEIYK